MGRYIIINQTEIIRNKLYELGADEVGFGDLKMLMPSETYNMPFGISIAVAYPKAVILGIAELPTKAYYEHYCAINERLDNIVGSGAEFIRSLGFDAIALTREFVGFGEDSDTTILPHKTVATLSGLGWVGKNALLMNARFGSAIRLSTIVTNAPIETSKPISSSNCGTCTKCRDACPAGAIKGTAWTAGIKRESLVDVIACRKVARERSERGFGIRGVTICGKCIEVCPFSQRYIR